MVLSIRSIALKFDTGIHVSFRMKSFDSLTFPLLALSGTIFNLTLLWPKNYKTMWDTVTCLSITVLCFGIWSLQHIHSPVTQTRLPGSYFKSHQHLNHLQCFNTVITCILVYQLKSLQHCSYKALSKPFKLLLKLFSKSVQLHQYLSMLNVQSCAVNVCNLAILCLCCRTWG